MGYAATDMVIYGVKLTDEQARIVFADLEPKCEEGCGIYLETPANVEVGLFSDRTDSRVHSGHYDYGYEHVFGFNYASNGYAADDDIVRAVKKTPKKVVETYETHVIPYLKSLGIHKKPKVLLINQVH